MDSQIGVSSISSRGGRYVFPYHADCILLATLETYKLCMNAGSSGCAHKFTVQKGDGGAWTTMPNKHKYYRSMSEQPIVDYIYGVENGNAEQFCDSWHGGDSAKSPVWAKIISAFDGSKLNHLFLLHPIRKIPVYMYIYSTFVCVCVCVKTTQEEHLPLAHAG